MENQRVILFDGVCNLCNWAVQFVLKHDKKEVFKFAALQSEYATKQLADQGSPKNNMESLVLIENGKIYRQSTAALRIAKQLSGGWKLLQMFLILPKFIRDPIYNFIARRRYRWFGKRAECRVPSPELKKRFLG